MFHYLLQILIFQFLFLLIYDILHKKDTFFNWNRLYLLIVPFLSLILPFIEIDLLSSSSAEIYVSNIERTIITSTQNTIFNVNKIETASRTSSQPINWWIALYLFGIVIASINLTLKLHKLHILKNISNITRAFDKRIIILPNSAHAFSFWNTIFIGDSLTEEQKKNIISHELVHVDHKHTIDQLSIEVLKMLLWWNPLIYIYQARITLLHEYIADSVTIHKVNQKSYIEQLLNDAFQTEKITFINQFFNQSLIKKRILMLQKSQSKSIAKFKYLLLIPVITGILTYTSCKDPDTNETLTIQEDENSNKNGILVSNQPACLNQNAKYNQELDNYLKITNGKNSDIIANLVAIETNEVIRAAIVYKSQTYFIRNIPEGIYRIDVIYGDQYTEKETDGSCSGFFEKESLREVGEDILDFKTINSEKGKDVPSYSWQVDLLPKNDSNNETFDTASLKSNNISTEEAEPLCANRGDTKYDYKIDNYLKFTNGENADLIVDIVSNQTSEVVRTVYLPKNTAYFTRNIPVGIYHLKIVYGEGYEENSKDGKCELSFRNKLKEEKGEDILDFTVIKTPEGINIPSYSITLDMLEEHKD
ncbi:M56 family metallopeptidase [Aquimarina sp. M1]